MIRWRTALLPAGCPHTKNWKSGLLSRYGARIWIPRGLEAHVAGYTAFYGRIEQSRMYVVDSEGYRSGREKQDDGVEQAMDEDEREGADETKHETSDSTATTYITGLGVRLSHMQALSQAP